MNKSKKQKTKSYFHEFIMETFISRWYLSLLALLLSAVLWVCINVL